MTTYDVIVVGVGGMGSAAAYHLAARGHSVLGVERFTPAHDRGSSHGRSRVTRQAYHEHPSYVPLVLRAYELWREVEQESGRQLLTVTGGIMVSTPGPVWWPAGCAAPSSGTSRTSCSTPPRYAAGSRR